MRCHAPQNVQFTPYVCYNKINLGNVYGLKFLKYVKAVFNRIFKRLALIIMTT